MLKFASLPAPLPTPMGEFVAGACQAEQELKVSLFPGLPPGTVVMCYPFPRPIGWRLEPGKVVFEYDPVEVQAWRRNTVIVHGITE